MSFDDQEIGLLESLQNKYGGTLPQVIRDAVKFRYDKAFPPHTRSLKRSELTKVAPEQDLSPEQKCEQKGGKVSVHNGIPVCEIRRSKSMTAYVPLTSPELF